MMLRATPFHALAILALATAPSLADERKPDASLPGVDGSYSLVAPAPEPDDPSPETSGTTRVGNWELTVSGYVWVQVGASSAGTGK